MHEVIRLLIIVIVAILIIYFGFTGLSTIFNKGCQSGIILLEKELQTSVEAISLQTGTVEEKKFNVPCGIEKIYFVDINKNVSFTALQKYPLIINSIKAEVKKNVFLIKDDKIVKSFYADDFEIEFPYYDCYLTKYGDLNVRLEGKEGKTGILKKDFKFDCTFTEPLPVELSPANLEEMLSQINATQDNVSEKENCTIIRFMLENEKNNITIIINNTANGECEYYENIPKCAVKNLNVVGEINITISNATPIADDPIIMWNFKSGSQSAIYKLLKKLNENCKREFKGVAIKKK